jgi:ferredoxin-2, mitochondrial
VNNEQYFSLFAIHCSLFTVRYSLFAVRYSLFTVHCSLFMQEVITITIIDRHDQAHLLEVPLDVPLSVMEVCKSYELPVEAVCGGMALCATCQVYIESDHALPEPSDDEWAMLDQAMHVRNNSRLGCQIRITPELDGLVARLAPEQV